MTTPEPAARPEDGPGNFVHDLVAEHVKAGKNGGAVVTRFPPEPNGYLHLGHAKSICLNFGLAAAFNGKCHLRFDDTNPETEDVEYVESIKADVRWLGFKWHDREYYASDYFEKLHAYAIKTIEDGKAYVDSRTLDEIRKTRGDYHQAGEASPFRDRSVTENLELFAKMRAGSFPDGAHVLRAKGDMASADVKLRDPIMYRIRHAKHHRTGDTWCIYPMYDWAHGQSDYIEGITHSILHARVRQSPPALSRLPRQHRRPGGRAPDADRIRAPEPIVHGVLSKRKLQALVEGKHVRGWDDSAHAHARRRSSAAAVPRRRSAPSAIASGYRRATASSTSPCSSTLFVKT